MNEIFVLHKVRNLENYECLLYSYLIMKICKNVLITNYKPNPNVLSVVHTPDMRSLITSKEPVCPRVELILKIIIILLIIFLGFSKNKP